MIIVESRGGRPGGQAAARGTALALGYFDGVHLGHRAVLEQALLDAENGGLDAAVFTFSPGQGTGIKGKAICTAGQKHRLLREMGFQYCFEPPVESFWGLSPRAFFEEMLVGELGARALACGEDYAFGARRAGGTRMLQTLCDEKGLALTIAPTTLWQGEPVSSSRIRQALEAGEIERANAMLGRPYEIDFPVRRGQGLGHTLGFPTLNQIFPDSLQPPRQGVYITQTLLDGRAYPSATGFGTRPTVSADASTTCETFVPNFSGNLYGEHVRVSFFKRIADTQKFTSPRQLAQEVQGWARQAERYFTQHP